MPSCGILIKSKYKKKNKDTNTVNPVDKIITQLKSKYKAIIFLLQNYDYISIFKFLKNVREEILNNQKDTYL